MPGVLGAELSKGTFFGKKLFLTLVVQDVLDKAEHLPQTLISVEVFNCWESCTGVALFVWTDIVPDCCAAGEDRYMLAEVKQNLSGQMGVTHKKTLMCVWTQV